MSQPAALFTCSLCIRLCTCSATSRRVMLTQLLFWRNWSLFSCCAFPKNTRDRCLGQYASQIKVPRQSHSMYYVVPRNTEWWVWHAKKMLWRLWLVCAVAMPGMRRCWWRYMNQSSSNKLFACRNQCLTDWLEASPHIWKRGTPMLGILLKLTRELLLGSDAILGSLSLIGPLV